MGPRASDYTVSVALRRLASLASSCSFTSGTRVEMLLGQLEDLVVQNGSKFGAKAVVACALSLAKLNSWRPEVHRVLHHRATELHTEFEPKVQAGILSINPPPSPPPPPLSLCLPHLFRFRRRSLDVVPDSLSRLLLRPLPRGCAVSFCRCLSRTQLEFCGPLPARTCAPRSCSVPVALKPSHAWRTTTHRTSLSWSGPSPRPRSRRPRSCLMRRPPTSSRCCASAARNRSPWLCMPLASRVTAPRCCLTEPATAFCVCSTNCAHRS